MLGSQPDHCVDWIEATHTFTNPYAMTDAVTANSVKPVGPVLGSLRAYLTEGNPPGGGPS